MDEMRREQVEAFLFGAGLFVVVVGSAVAFGWGFAVFMEWAHNTWIR